MRWAAVGCLVANVAAFPWQGTFPELALDANDTVAAVTETLYAADEVLRQAILGVASLLS